MISGEAKPKPLTCYYCDEAFQPGDVTGEDEVEIWHVRCLSLGSTEQDNARVYQ